jgi:head-tail adaptor
MRSRIRAGDLRTPVRIDRPTITQDDGGGEVINWTSNPPVPSTMLASVEPLSGREWANAVMLKDAVDYLVTIRYMPSCVPNARWRVVNLETNAIMSVVAVMVHQKHGLVELMCKSTMGDTDGR